MTFSNFCFSQMTFVLIDNNISPECTRYVAARQERSVLTLPTKQFNLHKPHIGTFFFENNKQLQFMTLKNNLIFKAQVLKVLNHLLPPSPTT